MNKTGKVWGNTKDIFSKNNVEVHRIFGKKNGYCSKHRHEHKYNLFFVERGSIKVSIWKEYGLVDETILEDQEKTVVDPGQYHQFEILIDDTVAFEIYWVELDSKDIEREDVGGLKEI